MPFHLANVPCLPGRPPTLVALASSGTTTRASCTRPIRAPTLCPSISSAVAPRQVHNAAGGNQKKRRRRKRKRRKERKRGEGEGGGSTQNMHFLIPSCCCSYQLVTPMVDSNRYLMPSDLVRFHCNGKMLSLSDWQALGKAATE